MRYFRRLSTSNSWHATRRWAIGVTCQRYSSTIPDDLPTLNPKDAMYLMRLVALYDSCTGWSTYVRLDSGRIFIFSSYDRPVLCLQGQEAYLTALYNSKLSVCSMATFRAFEWQVVPGKTFVRGAWNGRPTDRHTPQRWSSWASILQYTPYYRRWVAFKHQNHWSLAD